MQKEDAEDPRGKSGLLAQQPWAPEGSPNPAEERKGTHPTLLVHPEKAPPMISKAHHNGGVMTVTSSATLDELMGQTLVEGGFITSQQLAQAREASKEGTALLDTLVASGLVTPETVTTVLSFRLGIPVMDLRQIQADPGAARLFLAEYARRHSVLPVKFDDEGGLCIAVWPSNSPISPSELATVTG